MGPDFRHVRIPLEFGLGVQRRKHNSGTGSQRGLRNIFLRITRMVIY